MGANQTNPPPNNPREVASSNKLYNTFEPQEWQKLRNNSQSKKIPDFSLVNIN
jgi:hypothetical protein